MIKNVKKNLDNALAAIEKNFGKGSIMKMTGDIQDYPHIPTGIISLDTALGIGGLPRGRIVEIFGPESSGKTTLTLHVIAEAQKAGGLAAFVDAEHALDPMYATNLDVDIPNLLIAQPDSGEDALEITEHLIRSNSLDVIVIDSVAALTPKAEIEGDMGQSHMGLQARLMSQAMRKLTAAIHKTGTLVIFINQLRQKIGVTWGSNETTTGGNALKFYCSVRLDIRRIGTTKKTINGVETPWTNQTRIKVAKNKVAPPFRQTEVDMMIGGQGFGVDKIGDLIDLAVKAGFVKKTGTWYSKGETKLGQGKANAVQFFNDNEDQLIALEKEVRGSIELVTNMSTMVIVGKILDKHVGSYVPIDTYLLPEEYTGMKHQFWKKYFA